MEGTAPAATAPPVGHKIPADVRRVAYVILLGMVMSVLDTTIVNVALQSLSRDLHTSLDDIQWVVTGYLLSLAAVIPVTGWAAKRFGTRRLYLLSIVLFTGGSALCGLATSAPELIAFRVVQGVGGGMILPIGQMLLIKKAGPANIARVMSAIGVPMVLAPVLGPTIGGILIDNAGWRWIFYINVPIGIAAFVAALRLLPGDTKEDAGPIDFLGLGLVGVGLVAVTYGLAEAGLASFGSPKVLPPLLIGLVLTAAFVVRSLHIPRPLLDMRLYANRAFSAASLSTFCLGAALFGGMILMPLYYQTVRHEDAVITGLLLMPQGLGAGIAMSISGISTDRLGAGVTALIGSLITVLFTVPFIIIGAHTPFVLIAGSMVLRGFGVGLSAMPAMTAAFRVLEPNQVNDATPQLNILQRVGGSIGTAILTVVLQSHLDRAGSSSSAQASSFATTYTWVLGAAFIAAIPTVLLIREERRAGRPSFGARESQEQMLDIL